MKIPKDLYDETQLKVLSLNGVNFNFSKDYSNDVCSSLQIYGVFSKNILILSICNFTALWEETYLYRINSLKFTEASL